MTTEMSASEANGSLYNGNGARCGLSWPPPERARHERINAIQENVAKDLPIATQRIEIVILGEPRESSSRHDVGEWQEFLEESKAGNADAAVEPKIGVRRHGAQNRSSGRHDWEQIRKETDKVDGER